MGCCASTDENRGTQKQSPQLHKLHQQSPCISKSPPRAEEESVKEVLSETPKIRPEPLSETRTKILKNEDIEIGELEEPATEKLVLPPKKPPLAEKQLPINGFIAPGSTGPVRACTTPEEVSEVSDMCSLSESISTSTLREEEQNWSKDSGEVIQKVYRSQGQNGRFTQKNRAFSGGRSPVRRSEPSPTRRRNPVSGPVQGLTRPADGPRREKPGRRSKSPATRANVGRSPSGRRNGPSPGRVRIVEGSEEKESGGRNIRKEEGENEWDGPNESLENPLVSLECFIFL